MRNTVQQKYLPYQTVTLCDQNQRDEASQEHRDGAGVLFFEAQSGQKFEKKKPYYFWLL